MSPLITIGIPCYNGGRWIRAAVESALGQTWPNVEIIVIDDGSTDDSLSVLREFGDVIRVESSPNAGVNRARNRIAELARGEWIQYLDADDYLLPEKIALQMEQAAPTDECDVIYSPISCENWIDDTPQKLEVHRVDRERDVYWQLMAWQLPQTGGALWRRSLLHEIGGWDLSPERICDEHELYFRALKAAARFRFAPTSRAVYRVWSNDTRCRRDPLAVVRCRTEVIESIHAWMVEKGLLHECHQAMAGQVLFEMARMFANHDIAQAREYHDAKRKRGLIHLAGSAAPRFYRAVYHTLGFEMAEKIAKLTRPKKRATKVRVRTKR